MSLGMMLGPVFTSGILVLPDKLPGIIRKVCSFNAFSWFVLLAAAHWGSAVWVGGMGAFLVGMASGMRGVFSLAAITAVSPADKRGVIFGAMNMVAVLSSVVMQWVTGIVIDFFPGKVPGTFTAAGYTAGFSAVSIAMALSLLAFRSLGREPLAPEEE